MNDKIGAWKSGQDTMLRCLNNFVSQGKRLFRLQFHVHF